MRGLKFDKNKKTTIISLCLFCNISTMKHTPVDSHSESELIKVKTEETTIPETLQKPKKKGKRTKKIVKDKMRELLDALNIVKKVKKSINARNEENKLIAEMKENLLIANTLMEKNPKKKDNLHGN
jgi:hypothetical protein